MSMQDKIGDMLTRIRNAQMAQFLETEALYSKINRLILDVLVSEGYIESYKVVAENNLGKYVSLDEIKQGTNQKRKLIIKLKYTSSGVPVISEIKRISKPARRMYSSVKGLKPFCSGLGTYILSTSAGVISDKVAREKNVAGEIICRLL